MKNFYVFLSILGLVAALSACKTQSSVQQPLPTSPAVDSMAFIADTVELDTFVGYAPPPQILVSLQRGGCHGKCPIYQANFYDDWTVVYWAEQHLEEVGVFEAAIDSARLQTIFDKAVETGFFQQKNYYPTQGKTMQEFPVTTTFVKYKGQEHRIENHHNAPIALQAFETFLDDFLETLDWKPLQNSR